MEPRDWLVLTLASQSEPIRIQKALFKLSQEAELPAEETYDFRPYNWGPFSPAIYDDLDSLLQDGTVERVRMPNVSWASYRLTALGKRSAVKAREKADAKAAEALARISAWIDERSFSKLLRDLYEEYPEMASHSLFRQAT